MDESPDVASELKERNRYNLMVPPEVVSRHKPITAFSDPKLLRNRTVLESMLKAEKMYYPCDPLIIEIQRDLTPKMREEVGTWMFEVCEEEQMHTSVFLRAIQYMNKFLTEQEISRTQLQLLGTVCLFISSKIAGTLISVDNLAAYTAYSVSPELIRDWEQFVLGILKWDVYGTVASDFVEFVLDLLPKTMLEKRCIILEKIKTFISYCAVHDGFRDELPSVIASACVVAAVAPLCTSESHAEVLCSIRDKIRLDPQILITCVARITNKVQVTSNIMVDGKHPDCDPPGSPESASATNANGGPGAGIKAR